jgi:hypothetical protein
MDRRRGWMMWWSGCLATATFVHLGRGMTGIPVIIGTRTIPLWISWAVVVLAGVASLWLVRKARGVG